MDVSMRRLSFSASLIAAVFLNWTLPLHALAARDAVPDSPPFAISTFGTPFTFTYLAWKDKIPVAGGHAVLKDLACKGGAGVNTQMDLSAFADLTPAFRVRTTASNTAKTIQLQLVDADDFSGSWQFALPPPSADFVSITPTGAVAVAKPNALHHKEQPVVGKLDLAHIVQYQVNGDWQKGVLDLELGAIVLVKPDAAMLAERERYAKQEAVAAVLKAKQDAEAQERLAREREQKVRAYSRRTARSPEVVHVSLVAPDILSLTIEAQHIVLSALSKYEPQPGDELNEEKSDRLVKRATLRRGGKHVGLVQGKNRDWFSTYESIEGDPLLESTTDDVAHYTVASTNDPAYAKGVKPVAVYRKSVPMDALLAGGAFPMRHRIYLKLPSRIVPGKIYSIAIDAVNVRNPNLTFTADLPAVDSEAVHVNQIGYRPDDPCKQAFLSVWLGTGGACIFPEGLRFSLIDAGTRASVFTGRVERVLAVDAKETFGAYSRKNYSNTSVYRMDFSTFASPGTYRVSVDGIGCSLPFEIGTAAWEKAFLVQMKGLYNQRSGTDLGPPYSDFKKPRDFHPDDGTVVTRSTYDMISKTPLTAMEAMFKGDTGEVVTNAWGGYHDAGDWNPRRVTHMQVTLVQLELVELFPAYFKAFKLNIPSTPGVPDIITEALFEIDCFRRIQRPDGGVPYGIETNGDPLQGELSWLSTQHAYVLAPNMRDSWFYAAVAARAAKVLKPIKPELAQVYEESAVRAFAWAEADYAKRKADGSLATFKDALWEIVDARNLSAVVLYDLTGNKTYHDIFLQETCLHDPKADIYVFGQHIQSHAAFLYARLDAAKVDPKIKANALATVLGMADRTLHYAAGNAFGVANRESGRPMFAGFFGTPGGMELVRAHYLTGRPEYLKGAVQSCLFPAGCNPNNIVYTTGLGANPVKHPLHVDSRYSGQPPPVGITIWKASENT